MIRNVLLLGGVSIILMSCKGVKMTTFFDSSEVPMYVTSGELASLTTGMSKEESKSNLGNLSPYDILVAQEDGCELHQYKYKKPAKEMSALKANMAEGLTEGDKRYIDESDAYLIYKNGKLESVLTDAGKEDAINLLNDISAAQVVCSEVGLRGCTDPQSLNYNPNAITDDASCEYCPCSYVKNDNFNSKRPVSDCNTKCIKIKSEEDIDKDDSKSNCTNCDLIDKLSKSNANININLDVNGQDSKGNSNDNGSKNSNNSKSSIINSNKESKKGINNLKSESEKSVEGKTVKKLVKIN